MAIRVVAARATPAGRCSALLRDARAGMISHPVNRPEIIRGCANARQLAKICDLLEGFPGSREISWDLHRGSENLHFQILADPELAAVLIEDPDLRPYLWDL